MADILLIDDNADLLMTLAFALELEGHQVSQALNGLEGQAHLRDAAAVPDLIIVDLQMPVMDGWTFAATLGDTGVHGIGSVPILVITASADEPAWGRATLRKPFEFDTFMSTVNVLLAPGA